MSALKNTFRLAIFDEFLDGFAALPKAQQKKVSKFLRLFRADPTSSSINYEKISDFKDPNLRTVRIDDAYRAIVLKPQTGNVYALLWVDHHDDAMDWARNKRCEIHPETGCLQVLAAAEEQAAQPEPAEPPKKTKKKPPPLFKPYSDDELVSVGVPKDLLGHVRIVRTRTELDALSGVLPPDAFEAVYWIAEGDTVDAVRQAMGLEQIGDVDTDDFEAALEKPWTLSRFAIITDDQELEAMLDAPLDKWRTYLHPTQRALVEKTFNGPARVLGGAGTGKTVVAMHRARHLAENVFTGPDDRILFTTFTTNLAQDIKASLESICRPEAMQRIEVVNLDRWVLGFLERQGYSYEIAYFPGERLDPLWDQALALRPDGFTEQFFREEWDYVVQPEGCTSYEDYKSARRAGRGVRLSRQQRKEIWKVYEAYRNLLDKHGLRESVDALRDASQLLEELGGIGKYRAIVVDEGQDMSTVAFELLRKVIPEEQANDLFIVGDGHQRIYRRKVVLRHAGVNIVGRSRKLYINYRTTDEIRRFAVSVLRDMPIDDLDGGSDDNRKYKSLLHGPAPTIRVTPNLDDEAAAIAEYVAQGDPMRTCLVTRRSKLRDKLESRLKQAGHDTYRLTRGKAEDTRKPGVRVATMHRVKGLEFDRLIVGGANDGELPLIVGDIKSKDGAVREEAEMRERALFYVAITRARREALITSGGKPSPWLEGLGTSEE